MSRIGKVIRDHRRSRGLNLTQLAELTGFSVGYLSKVENDKTDPSISACQKIAKALNVRMSEIFGEVEKEETLSVVRKNERQTIAREGSEIGYTYEALATGFMNRLMDPYILTDLAYPEERPFFQHDGQEMIYILQGQVSFQHDGREMILNEGDCVYFDASLPHSGKPTSDTKVQMLLIMCDKGNDLPEPGKGMTTSPEKTEQD